MAAVIKIGGAGIMGGLRNLFLFPPSPLDELKKALPQVYLTDAPGGKRMRLLGFEELTRLALALVALYLLGWVRALAFSLLPRAVVQFGRRVWFRHGGRRIVVRSAAITAIDVELRPSGEVFVLELEGGQIYDLCPVAWEGAQRIFKVLHRRVVRARRRRARELRRAKPA